MAAEPMKQGPTVDRRSYLGGSEIAAAIGLSKFRSPLDIWARKTGRAEDTIADHNVDRAASGNALERPVLEKLYAEKHGLKLWYPGTLIDPDDSWVGATPDALSGRNDPEVDAQCKIVGRRAWIYWEDPVSEGGGDDSEVVPPDPQLQVQWELHVIERALGIKLPGAHIVAQIGTDTVVYKIQRDDDMIGTMRELAARFWHDHVVADKMPEVTGQALEAVRELFPEPIRDSLDEPTDEAVRLAREYDAARAAAKEAEREKDRAAAALQAAIGERLGFEGRGIKATWKVVKGQPKWRDIAEELAEGPVPKEIVERHRSKGRRQLNVRITESTNTE